MAIGVRVFALITMAAACGLAACDKDSPTAPTSQQPPPVVTQTPAPPAAPTLTSVAPATIISGAATTVTLTGTNFVAGSTVAVTGSGITVGDVAIAGSTSITARLAVADAADIGARSVTVTTPAGTTSGQTLTITPITPTIASANPSFAPPGSTLDVTFRGTGFVPGATTVTVSGSGITVLNVTVANGPEHSGAQDEAIDPTVAGNATSVTARLAIDRNASPGTRTVTVSTAGGTSTGFTFTISAPFPVIGSFRANPVIIQRGSSSNLSWSGITHATSCSININIGPVPCADGGIAVSPTVTTEYMLTATGPGGREWTYVTVNVEDPLPPVVNSRTFNFVGAAVQTFTVPAGVTTVTITAIGAGGGGSTDLFLPGAFGGAGARVTGTFVVTPGTTLKVIVGGGGSAGAPALPGLPGAGGGGGGSFVFDASNALLIAAGGGGGGGQTANGANAPFTQNGGASGSGDPGGSGGNGAPAAASPSAGGGGGGTLSGGGAGNGGSLGGGPTSAAAGGAPGAGGGVGGAGGFGGGGGGYIAGGGGGGYSGGASGAHTAGGGGMFNAGTNPSTATGAAGGQGSLSGVPGAPSTAGANGSVSIIW